MDGLYILNTQFHMIITNAKVSSRKNEINILLFLAVSKYFFLLSLSVSLLFLWVCLHDNMLSAVIKKYASLCQGHLARMVWQVRAHFSERDICGFL